jgi:hypothetical protein
MALALIPPADLELAVGAQVDARDKEGKWVAATVIKLSASASIPDASEATTPPLTCDRKLVRYVRVNFVGWSSKWVRLECCALLFSSLSFHAFSFFAAFTGRMDSAVLPVPHSAATGGSVEFH